MTVDSWHSWGEMEGEGGCGIGKGGGRGGPVSRLTAKLMLDVLPGTVISKRRDGTHLCGSLGAV